MSTNRLKPRASSARLHRLFASLLPGIGAATVACGGSTSDPSGDAGTARPPIFDTLTSRCLTPQEQTFGFPRDAILASGVDYIGGYTFKGVNQASDPHVVNAAPDLIAGEACRTAADKAACIANLEKDQGTAAPSWSPGGQAYRPVQVRLTKGDSTVIISKAEDVPNAYLPIDTASEALARVSAHGVYGNAGCSGNDVLKEASGSYLVYAMRGGARCDPNDASKGVSWKEEYVVRVQSSGAIELVSKHATEKNQEYGCLSAGRRPPGFLAARPQSLPERARSVASYLATMAHLEAASIVAFDQLVSELRHHGAPSEIIARSLEAKSDEVRHARDIARLAIEGGAAVPALIVASRPLRSLVDLAIDNAIEGCVRETYGALIAHRQAVHAVSPEIRHVMQSIATEETEHAALSWDLHDWLLGQLDPEERVRVEAAFERAVAMLALECLGTEPDDVRAELGLPDGAESRALATGLFGHIAHAA